jgi:hypothetical protein
MTPINLVHPKNRCDVQTYTSYTNIPAYSKMYCIQTFRHIFWFLVFSLLVVSLGNNNRVDFEGDGKIWMARIVDTRLLWHIRMGRGV